MKALLLIVTLGAVCACDHADKTPKPVPPPTPAKPDPIAQAHDELELLPEAAGSNTTDLYARSTLMPDGASIADGFDCGDFIGRLRALFGPRDGDMYVLRDKRTGTIVTAYCTHVGPFYGGTPDAAGVTARRLADPIVQGPPPGPGDQHALHVYSRHVDDASAGPTNTAVLTRLEALVSQVAPADFAELKYDPGDPSVHRIGAKAGHSFDDVVPPTDGIAFLLGRAQTSETDEAIIAYYLAHKSDLAAHKSDALAALSRLTARAKTEPDPDARQQLQDEILYDRQLLR